MLDGLEDVKGVMHHQGLSYVPEVIRTELISRYHDEGTLASIQLKNLLLGNSRETCNCRYRYLPIAEMTQTRLLLSTNWKDTSHDLGGIAYVYQLKGHELRFDPCHHRPADLLGGFINRFCDGISAGKAPTMI